MSMVLSSDKNRMMRVYSKEFVHRESKRVSIDSKNTTLVKEISWSLKQPNKRDSKLFTINSSDYLGL